MRSLFIALVVAACGSNNLSKPKVAANKDNVCDQIASVVCYDLYTCCSEGQIQQYLMVGDPESEDQCKSDVARLCEQKVGVVDSSLQMGRVTFDATTMNACLGALLPPDNTCSTVSAMLPWAMACATSAWVGAVAVGAACDYTFECAGMDVYCAANQTCTALPGNGMPCGAPGCATGFYCGGGTCRAQGAAGAMCGNSRQCLKGLYCDQNTNMCAMLAGAGQPCTGDQSCASGQCIPGTCASNANQTCFVNSDCLGTCSNNGTPCQQARDCGNGTCSIGGATCRVPGDCVGAGNMCVFPNTCNGGTCQGEVVCTASQFDVNYCTGAVAAAPSPPQ